ncbi:MAG: hypothetical protein WCG25_01550 [bacterium]
MTILICIFVALVASIPTLFFIKTWNKVAGIIIYLSVVSVYSFVVYTTYGTDSGGIYSRVKNWEWKNDLSQIKPLENPAHMVSTWDIQKSLETDKKDVTGVYNYSAINFVMGDGDDSLFLMHFMSQRTLSDDLYDTMKLFLYAIWFFIGLTFLQKKSI